MAIARSILNRLAWASAAGKTTRYGYTADGQRNKKEGPVDTACFCGAQLEMRWNAAGDQNLLTKYIYAGPVLVARREADGPQHWYHQDHLSSTVAMSDATRLPADGRDMGSALRSAICGLTDCTQFRRRAGARDRG